MGRAISYVLTMIVVLGFAAFVANMAADAIQTNMNKATANFERR